MNIEDSIVELIRRIEVERRGDDLVRKKRKVFELANKQVRKIASDNLAGRIADC